MADDSPGKVQALRALFAEKNAPVMGLRPPPRASWRPDDKKKVPPTREKSPSSKPVVGPKPAHLQRRTAPPGVTTTEASRSRAFADVLSSFLFDGVATSPSAPPPPPQDTKPSGLQNGFTGHEPQQRQSLITCSDNYVCRVRRKELPPVERLGPAPLKPARPPHMSLPPPKEVPPACPVQRVQQRPCYPCPPRPVTPPPLPPNSSAPVIKPPPSSLREEIEELYEDTLTTADRDKRRPVSLIPEYTEEEEQAELYHDAVGCFENSEPPLKYKKPPPPVPSEYLQPNVNGSTEELYQDADGVEDEEFYEVMPCDEIPEDDANGSPLYSNNKKEIEKMRKEEEKRLRKEQKEREKRDKELDKLRKKFGLTGEEIPIDDGLVKWDSRGSRGGDLPVKKGETVLILRMEGNPSGRWLVKNEKGKIGYVELTNIEVDPLSVKSVMSIRRLSVISNGEELYCEAKSQEEAIYEVTY